MNKIASFIKLDILSLKSNYKMLVLIFASLIILVYPPSLAPVLRIIYLMSFAIFMIVIACSYFFASEEKSDMQKLYACLPLNRTKVVVGRYLSSMVLGISCLLCITLIVSIYISIKGGISLILLAEILLNIIGTFMILIACEYPVFFKLGFAKSQSFAAIIPMIVFWGTLFFINRNRLQFTSLLKNSLGFTSGVLVVIVGIGTQIVSIMISCRIYQKKEL